MMQRVILNALGKIKMTVTSAWDDTILAYSQLNLVRLDIFRFLTCHADTWYLHFVITRCQHTQYI